MATRGEIRDAFTEELETLSGTYDVVDEDGSVVDTVTLDAADIGLRDPEQLESQPSIVYHENYQPVTYNGVGTGPSAVTRTDGSVDAEWWHEYVEAQFIIDVRASNEGAKEPLYEALREVFGKYQFDPWDERDFHPAVIDIDVLDSVTADTGDAERVIRGDQLEVQITFYRAFELATDNITQANIGVDTDGDDIADNTYTVN